MTFVNLSLLAGAGLIAVPIILHLIMRQKPRHFEFPALRFIQKRHDANRRRLRLRHLLLLLLRAAAIALLAFALARPSVKLSSIGATGSQKAPIAAALVFDTAKRMDYAYENQTRLDAARQWGLWLVSQFPPESEIAVLDTCLGPGAFQVDRGSARHRIERLETIANSQPLTTTIEEAARLLGQSRLAQREIYVLTDLARAAWPPDAAARLQERLGRLRDAGIYVVDVGVPQHVNSGLGELRLSSQVLSGGAPLHVDTSVSHSGPETKRTVQLFLSEDDSKTAERRWVKRDERIVELRPDQSQALEFALRSLEPGTRQGYVQIVGEDALLADNRRYFTVEVRPAWRVLVAAPEPADHYAVYLTEALAPAAFRRTAQAPFECEVIDQDQLAEQSLDGCQAVFLLDPKPLAPAVWRKLGDFVAQGHGVGVFLGRNAQPIEAFNDPAAQELLPAPLVRQARAPAGDVALAPQSYQHPILAAFQDRAGSVPWDAFPVYRWWQLGKTFPGVNTVLPLTSGEPAVLERSLGRGRVMTATTPVSDRPNEDPWNLLPVGESWPFVILANKMAAYLVGAADERLNYSAGQTAVLSLDPQKEFKSYSLTGPDNVAVRLTPDLKRQVLTVTSTNEVGNYRVEAGGTDEGVDRGFSVNLAPEQTELDRLADADLEKIFGPAVYRLARDRRELEGKVFAGRVGRELFPVLILLVAVVLGIEQVLANRFYRE